MRKGTTHNAVWLHGWGTGPRVWQSLVQRVGMARNAYPSFRPVAHRDDFSSVTSAEIGERDVVLIGWSMGAAIAVETACAVPDRVKAVVMISANLRFTDPRAGYGWAEEVLKKMKRRLVADPSATLDRFVRSMFGKGPGASDVARAFIRHTYAEAPFANSTVACDDDRHVDLLSASDFTVTALAAGLDYLMYTDLYARFQRLTIPVLWIHGGADQVCPTVPFRDVAREAGGGATRCEFKEIATAGHVPFFPDPTLCGDLITGFLDAAICR